MRQSPYWPPVRDALLLYFIHGLGLMLMGQVRIVDQLLAPGGGSPVYLVLGVMFTCTRLFVLTLAPGWILARLFWIWSGLPDSGSRDESPRPDKAEPA